MATAELNLSNTLDDLTRLMSEHLGVKSGASTPTIPHTQLCAIGRGNYSLTNVADSRTLDTSSVSLFQLANILATVIADLQSVKILGGTNIAGTVTPSSIPSGVYY